jgi:hypothetical protein
MTPHLGDKDWRAIAEKASKEMDPAKLAVLIAQLCDSLDERNAKPPWQRNETRAIPAN